MGPLHGGHISFTHLRRCTNKACLGPLHGGHISFTHLRRCTNKTCLGPLHGGHIFTHLRRCTNKPEGGRPPMADPSVVVMQGRKAQLITVFFKFHHSWIHQRQTQYISQQSQEPHQFRSTSIVYPSAKQPSAEGKVLILLILLCNSRVEKPACRCYYEQYLLW